MTGLFGDDPKPRGKGKPAPIPADLTVEQLRPTERAVWQQAVDLWLGIVGPLNARGRPRRFVPGQGCGKALLESIQRGDGPKLVGRLLWLHQPSEAGACDFIVRTNLALSQVCWREGKGMLQRIDACVAQADLEDPDWRTEQDTLQNGRNRPQDARQPAGRVLTYPTGRDASQGRMRARPETAAEYYERVCREEGAMGDLVVLPEPAQLGGGT